MRRGQAILAVLAGGFAIVAAVAWFSGYVPAEEEQGRPRARAEAELAHEGSLTSFSQLSERAELGSADGGSFRPPAQATPRDHIEGRPTNPSGLEQAISEAAQADFQTGLLYTSLLRERMDANPYDARAANTVRLELLAMFAEIPLEQSRVESVRCGGGLCEAIVVHPSMNSVESFNQAALSGRFSVVANGGTSNLLERGQSDLRYSVFLARPGTQLPTLDQLDR